MKSIKNFILCVCVCVTTQIWYSCQSDDDSYKFIKSWQLVAKTKEEATINLTVCESQELISFSTQNVCYMYNPCNNKDLRTAWNYDNGSLILNIADLLPITFYLESISLDKLIIKYYIYNSEGKLEKYTKEYKQVDTTIENGKLRLKE